MDSGNLLLDERFHLLLHKKIMDKKALQCEGQKIL